MPESHACLILGISAPPGRRVSSFRRSHRVGPAPAGEHEVAPLAKLTLRESEVFRLVIAGLQPRPNPTSETELPCLTFLIHLFNKPIST